VRRDPDAPRQRDAGLRSVGSGGWHEPESTPQVKMHITEPRSFSEAQSIADKLKADTPVIMNLTMTDPDLAKRFIDFASGLTYGLDGGLQKVADRVFMLTPANVSVSAEDRRRLRDKGLFSLDG
jgi:cell division inhibitor SepF